MIGNTMTVSRRQRGRRLPGALAAALIGPVAMLGVPYPARLNASTTEYVVVDRNTGLAINGFDPVAYFVDGAAVPGKAEFEFRHAGVVWRFRNEGNRQAFIADPEVYAPRFGGYDPVEIVRGMALPGDPRLWLMVGKRLFLFNRPATRTTLAADPERSISIADRKWPDVQLTLSP